MTSLAGVATEVSLDGGMQAPLKSLAHDREQRRETDNDRDTDRPTHTYKSHHCVMMTVCIITSYSFII